MTSNQTGMGNQTSMLYLGSVLLYVVLILEGQVEGRMKQV